MNSLQFYLFTILIICKVIILKCQSNQIVTEFHTEAVSNEYIVNFNDYLWPPARKKILTDLLDKQNIKQWRIIQRNNNEAKQYPSDFDVITIDNATLTDLSALTLHRNIKRITEHRKVHRRLQYVDVNDTVVGRRRLLRIVPKEIYEAVGAITLWKLGVTGKGVKVAIFDTGLPKNHPHFRHVKERTNWTNEKSLDDGVSHGTFVAGIIASQKECKGIAPDTELHIYRVFTNSQVSYTSWFLDAFNFAIFRKINVLNLSIGGPDFLDQPFVDKVLELSANKVIMVSAIGNDGPLYGTLNNPGDQSDVIGVGGINFEEKVAKFSSRGMTTWELDWGYGRLKPDIVTYGSQVKGSNIRGGCRALSGTSVASPIVAGAISLIISGIPEKMDIVNPASIKQILIEGATRLPDNNMFEQGHGKLDVIQSMKLLLNYKPKVTLSPSYVDFTDSYMWPYNSQQLFCGSIPTVVNITILNGIAVSSRIIGQPTWHPYSDKHGELLNVAITHSSLLWPWAGWMAVHLSVKPGGCKFEGIARGVVRLTVQSPIVGNAINSTIDFPITVKIIAQPPRHKRLLWDQFHSLRYPPGYVPRDNLKTKADPLDWRADHIHTNFRDMYNHLRNSGFYIDVLRQPYTCFNASEYGTLLIVDPEEEFFDEEISKLYADVYNHGLSIIVFADWYNVNVMKKIKFFDENTRQWWIPDTGGANIPALNELLKPYGISFGDIVAEGYYKLGDHEMYYASGSNIIEFPKENEDSILVAAKLNDQGAKILDDSKNAQKPIEMLVPILGMFQPRSSYKTKYISEHLNNALPSSYEDNNVDQSGAEHEISQEKNPLLNKRILLSAMHSINENNHLKNRNHAGKRKLDTTTIPLEGRIVVFGDSNCLDSTHMEKACYWLLDALLEYTTTAYKTDLLKNLNMISKFDTSGTKILPPRMAGSNLNRYSKVLESNNKFKKKPIKQCEVPRWANGGVAINSTQYRQHIEENTHKKQNLKDFDLKGALEISLMRSQQKTKYPEEDIFKGASTFEDDSMRIPLIFIIIITFLVLSFFIKWFKRKRRGGGVSLLP